jgi:integrase
VDVKTAQHRLGHANVTMTLKVYARATEEADRRAADLVGERFRPRDKRGIER